MLATISPADVNVETNSTLRFAQIAKKVKSRAVINENATSRLIRELREELSGLRKMLDQRRKDAVNQVPRVLHESTDEGEEATNNDADPDNITTEATSPIEGESREGDDDHVEDDEDQKLETLVADSMAALLAAEGVAIESTLDNNTTEDEPVTELRSAAVRGLACSAIAKHNPRQ